MYSLSRALRVGLFTLVAGCGVAAASLSATPLSAELASRKPEFLNVSLSPDGTAIAYQRIGDDDLMSLEILDLASGEKKGVAGTENFDVGSYSWIDDQRLVVLLTEDKIFGVGIYVFDRKSGRLAEIRNRTESPARLVSIPRDRTQRVIASTYGETAVLMELASNIDLKNRSFGSTMETVKKTYPAPPEGRVQGYVPNVAGEPALASVFLDETNRAFLLDREEATWTLLPLDLEETPILAVSEDGSTAWVARRAPDGGSSIYRYNLRRLRFGKEVYHDPDYDLAAARLVLSRDGKELQGIQYSQVRAVAKWFDADLAAAHERLSTALQGYDVLMLDRSEDQQRAVFIAKSSTDPGQYFLADLKSGGIQHIAGAAPWLEGVPLSPAMSFNYKARDGLSLQAYLTLPTDPEAKKPYPLVVLGHGGPWARDTWNYDGEVQFLASRGFAVVRPNYRGSTGFRTEVSVDDRFDFRKMHDDVTDAVQALIRNGLADPDKVGIMGASFGGYLAIAGAAWEPELYAFAITNVGVFDWDMLIADSRRESYIFYHWLMKNVGSNPEAVERFSPLNQVDEIRCPVFIAHGRKDIRVDISQSVRLERALKSRGVPHMTYYEGDSAHGFAAAEAQTAYLQKVDEFLQSYFFHRRPEVLVGPSSKVD